MSAAVERGVVQEYQLSELDGATKAALLLLAVNRDKAVELLKRLDAGEVKLIAQGAERLGAVTPDLLAGVIANFKTNFEDGIKFLGTTDEVRKLIVEAVGQEAIADHSALDAPAAQVPTDLWSCVGQLSIEELKSYIRGHTDATNFRTSSYDNWRLSTARAHMAHYMMQRAGLHDEQLEKIEGLADKALRVPSEPYAAQNRRIEILLRAPKS